ncbi:MAG: hypothetical protein JWM36_4524 [Hyphomicrobiales bacterium]|nr:hypothetical protein [Hyphomicrobiales bacterium]
MDSWLRTSGFLPRQRLVLKRKGRLDEVVCGARIAGFYACCNIGADADGNQGRREAETGLTQVQRSGIDRAPLKRFAHRMDFGAVLLTLVAWCVSFPAMIPVRFNDRGVFVSTAERLLAGDALYAGVYDNKEPLFYYFVAIQRYFGAGGEIAAEVFLVLICCLSIFAVAVTLCSRSAAAIVSFALAPIVITGGFYLPGHTHLPGTALIFLCLALCWTNRPFLGGVLLAVLAATKLPLAPLGGAIVLTVVVWRGGGHGFVRCAAGGILAGSGIVALLYSRGELGPFWQAFQDNLAYAQGGPIAGARSPWLDHLVRVKSKASALAVLAILLCAAIAVRYGVRRQRSDVLILVGCCLLTGLASIAVLALSGLWPHHNQILYVPACLALLAAAPAFDAWRQDHAGVAVVAAVLMALTLGGALDVFLIPQRLMGLSRTLASLNELSPETIALLDTRKTGAYARLGGNDDMAHAIGLRAWRLSCPKFHQYPFGSREQLHAALACALRAPNVVVARSFQPVETRPLWNEFVADAERALTAEFECTNASGIRICRRKADEVEDYSR